MTQRATRLLQLLDDLRRRRRPVRGAQLAAQLGVSLRTLYRDIEALRGQGADIAGDRLSQRTIWPFAMAFLDDRRLLAAWCELRGGFRHFRADRVLRLEAAGRHYPQTRHGLLQRWREHERIRQRD